MEFSLLVSFVTFILGITVLGQGYEVEIIHRDSPLSPLYNHSSTLIERARDVALRSHARLNRLSSSDVPSLESVITTGGGEFLMDILIGTPPITTYATIDTGSDLIWLQCLPCIQCFPQNTSFFDPSKSSSFHKIECSSTFCHSILPSSNINCTLPTDDCKYTYGYEDQSSSKGVLATETLIFRAVKKGEVLTAKTVVFGCGNNNTGSFPRGSSGVVGLGGGSLSLISQLGSQMQRVFSYCLPKTLEISGKLKFGVSSSLSSKMVSTPLILDEAGPLHYYVILEGITVGGKKLVTKEMSSSKGKTMMDSGTTLTYLEPYLYSFVVITMKELISLPAIPDPTMSYTICYPTESLKKIQVPMLIFHFSGADIELRSFNMFTSIDNLSCLSIAEGSKNVYGNDAQKNFEIEYNLERKVVSFEPTECSWRAAGNRDQGHTFFAASLCNVLVLVLLVYLI